MERVPAFNAVLPASVRYDPELTHAQKLLYAELTAMCDASGRTNVRNSDLCELFDTSQSTITRNISQLEHQHHIKITGRGKGRVINVDFITDTGSHRQKATYAKMTRLVDGKTKAPCKGTTENDKTNLVTKKEDLTVIQSPGHVTRVDVSICDQIDTINTSVSQPSKNPSSRRKGKRGQSVARRVTLIVDEWNALCSKSDFKRAVLTDDLHNRIATLLEYYPAHKTWQRMIAKVESVPVLSGDAWFSLRWIVKKQENFQKILDGVFDWRKEETTTDEPEVEYTDRDRQVSKVLQQALLEATNAKADADKCLASARSINKFWELVPTKALTKLGMGRTSFVKAYASHITGSEAWRDVILPGHVQVGGTIWERFIASVEAEINTTMRG